MNGRRQPWVALATTAAATALIVSTGCGIAPDDRPQLEANHDVPFDLRPIRTLKYLNNGEGKKGLSEGVEKRLQTITTEPE